MKKLLVLLLIILAVTAQAKVIKELPEDLLNACLMNMQVGDPMLSGDKPTVKLGNTPYSWIISWKNQGQGTGFVSLPTGAFADTRQIKVKYKINSLDNATFTIKNQYNNINKAE